MYNYHYVLNYKHYDNDDKYREDFCKLFNIDSYNHETIMNIIKSLYETYKDNPQFIELIQFSKDKFNEDDDDIAFMYLFSWDYLENLHKCLNELKSHNIIPKDLILNTCK